MLLECTNHDYDSTLPANTVTSYADCPQDKLVDFFQKGVHDGLLYASPVASHCMTSQVMQKS